MPERDSLLYIACGVGFMTLGSVHMLAHERRAHERRALGTVEWLTFAAAAGTFLAGTCISVRGIAGK